MFLLYQLTVSESTNGNIGHLTLTTVHLTLTIDLSWAACSFCTNRTNGSCHLICMRYSPVRSMKQCHLYEKSPVPWRRNHRSFCLRISSHDLSPRRCDKHHTDKPCRNTETYRQRHFQTYTERQTNRHVDTQSLQLSTIVL